MTPRLFLNSNHSNCYPYMWDKAEIYRGCILVAETYEGHYYSHYFDQYGDAAIINEAPCTSVEAALEVARLAVDRHIEQAIRDGEYLFHSV